MSNQNKFKFYVVWKGKQPGIFQTWKECQEQIQGVEGAMYKSFFSLEEATKAFEQDPFQHIYGNPKKGVDLNTQTIIVPSISVDAACSGNPGILEYQGVHTATKEIIFKMGPFHDGTNNIGEFLALVHGISLLKKEGHENIPIYSDSKTAMAWVKNKKVKTTLQLTTRNQVLFDYISRAELWLQNNHYKNPILKWDTKNWGEIPADFGRK